MWTLEVVLLFAFASGFGLAAAVAMVLIWCFKPKAPKDLSKPRMSLIYPEKIFLTRTGRVYHVREKCHRRDTDESMSEFRLCLHCSKETAKCEWYVSGSQGIHYKMISGLKGTSLFDQQVTYKKALRVSRHEQVIPQAFLDTSFCRCHMYPYVVVDSRLYVLGSCIL